MNKIISILVGALVWAAASAVASAEPQSIAVLGWALPDLSGAAPQRAAGDDPVVGRQICPALTRLNLSLKKSEELLLKRVSHEHPSSGDAVVFHYELRPGLFWWSGQAVTGAELAGFLRAQLPLLAAERSDGLWTVPKFEVRTDGRLGASIHFQQEPPFGPFIVNGAPFFRSVDGGQKSSFAFECVGLYRPTLKPFGLLLLPVESYKSTKELPQVAIYQAAERPAKLPPQYVELRYASAITSTPEQRPSDRGSGCNRTLELPQVAMIVWNTQNGLMANPGLRRALSALIPRAALVAAGTAQLAEVTSSLVPHEHPGYHHQTSTHGFDLHAASAELNRLGYIRKTSGSPRLDSAGAPLTLTFVAYGPSPNLAEKVLADTFAAVGIRLEFRVGSKQDADSQLFDGTLALFDIDWPRLNLLGNFHRGRKVYGPFNAPSDAELDHLLERYAASLTTLLPDFTSLMQVQKRLAELEPVTVLFRQKACLESGPAVRLPAGSLNLRDPDWFRRLLL